MQASGLRKRCAGTAAGVAEREARAERSPSVAGPAAHGRNEALPRAAAFLLFRRPLIGAGGRLLVRVLRLASAD